MKKPKLYVKLPTGRYIEYKEAEETDGNVYVRRGSKYVPLGVWDKLDWKGDGLWLVRHNTTRVMNADYYAHKWGLTKVADVPVTDVSRIGTAADIRDAIDNYLFNKYGYTLGNVSHQDLADELTAVVMNLNNNSNLHEQV